MNSLAFLVAVVLVSSAHAQYEAGFVKILEDQRYQDGAAFGNFRNQEDGIKYKEETNLQGVRTGFWEYPDETGQIKRVEFEAGPGIGFRIVSSNLVDPTPVHAKKTPAAPRRQQQQQHQQAPVQRAPQQHFLPQPAHQPLPQVRAQPQPLPQARPHPQPLPQARAHPQQLPQTLPLPQQSQPNNLIIARQPAKPVVQPEPLNLFDYPADLQFFRNADGHSFKFTAV